MSENTGKLKITVTSIVDVSGDWDEAFPGCKTIADVAAMRQQWVDDGVWGIDELINCAEDREITIEPAEGGE